ncbi:hypothetical protein GYB57_13845 [bacterium]|nr:hypothetical protein [bacterium]
MRIAIYIIYNIVYLIGSVWFLLYANTYLNSKFIPDSLRWQDGQVREDLTWFGITLFVLLLLELIVIGFVNYRLNKWYVGNFMTLNSVNNVLWATGIVLGLLLLFIILLNISAYS